MENLEKKFWQVADSLTARNELVQTTRKNLEIMKDHSEGTYLHELRVALIAKELADFCHCQDVRPEFFGGANHDVGKLAVKSSILSKGTISEADYQQIKKHAQAGAKYLKDFYYTSLIAGLHHRHQEHGYGLPPTEIADSNLDAKSKERLESAVVNVALADYFDAATTRRNDFFGHSKHNIQKIMNENFYGYTDRVSFLFKNKQIHDFMAPYQLNIDTSG